MKQWHVHPGDTTQPLRQVDVTSRQLGAHDVRVRVEAAALNFRDQLLIQGVYPSAAGRPIVPLSDGAGEVVEVGSGVTRVSVGDRVTATTVWNWVDGPFRPEMGAHMVGFAVDGWLAEEVVVPETGLVVLPDAMSYAGAATLPCAGVTAWNAIVEAARIGPGDAVLTLGTGGVSMFAIQIAKLVGARALVTSSSDDKLARARSAGADGGINYRTRPDWQAEARELTGGAGVDLVIENVGSLRQSVQATRYGGMVTVIGALARLGSSPSTPDADLADLLRTGVTVTPILMGNRRMLARLVTAFVMHRIEPVIDRTFAFDDAPAAYDALRAAEHVGKLVVTM